MMNTFYVKVLPKFILIHKFNLFLFRSLDEKRKGKDLVENGSIESKWVGCRGFDHKGVHVWCPNFPFNEGSWMVVVIGLQIA